MKYIENYCALMLSNLRENETFLDVYVDLITNDFISIEIVTKPIH